ncbi:MAG: alpha/beta fold hydrolase, partial [Ferruginibacter sp.]
GKINAGISLRIVFHFTQDSSGKLITTMDSPDQSTVGLPTDFTLVQNDSIYTGIEKYKVFFSGKLISDTVINGFFKQTIPIPLLLRKVSAASVTIRRQTPVAPFPYNSENITYPSVNGVKIAGTITTPKLPPNTENIQATKYPALILISGSGPQNRDEEILGHKPFAVIADYLTKKGFIVLRVDDRGTGESTGEYNKATSLDFADDIQYGLNYLKKRADIDTGKIGMLGHSEGAMIAQIIAAKRKDIDFLIMLAGPGIKTIDLMTEQNLAIFKTMGITKNTIDAYGPLYKELSLAIVNSRDSLSADNASRKVFNKWVKGKDSSILKELKLLNSESQRSYLNAMISTLRGPWYKYFLSYNPSPYLQKIHAKILVLNGEKDIQVLSKTNLAGMQASLQKTKSDFEIHEIKGINHLFQKCNNCTLSEYGVLEETISPTVLQLIGNWLERKVQNGRRGPLQ